MPKKSVSTKELFKDLKDGFPNEEPIEKYGITEKGLESVIQKLLKGGSSRWRNPRREIRRTKQRMESARFVKRLLKGAMRNVLEVAP